MGRETRAIGRNLQEGPDINIARVPLNGRTFEAYGEDPHLAGQIAAATVKGIQSEGTIGEPKHYLANSQEIDRDKVDEQIDERTLRQIYLPAFETAVKDGRAGAVMCAKNKINGAYACEHDELQQGVLKDEWGFKGFVVSDFSSCHDTIRCAIGGLDFELPDGTRYGDPLKAAVLAGQVSTATLDDHVHRILATMLRFGLFERSQPTTPIDAAARRGRRARRRRGGTVLLKNSARRASAQHPSRPVDRAHRAGRGTRRPRPAAAARAWLRSTTSARWMRSRAGPASTSRSTAPTACGPVDLGPQPALPAVHGDGRRTAHPARAAGPPATTTTPRGPASRCSPASTRGSTWTRPAASRRRARPPNGWSVRWTGTFTAPIDGDYTFNLTNHAHATVCTSTARA